MRVWGRTFNEDGSYQWVAVETDANGSNDAVMITTLIRCILLVLGESPFFGDYGIPAQQSVVQQVFPDFYINQLQRQFAPFFASLIVAKVASPTPTYRINLVTQQGVPFQRTIAGNDQP